MAKRGVPKVMPQCDRPCEVGVEPKRIGNGVADRIDMKHMLHAGADMVVVDVEKNLRFVLEPAKSTAMQNARVIPCKGSPDITLFLIQWAGAVNQCGPFCRKRGVVLAAGVCFKQFVSQKNAPHF
ncbi:hypothetical protein SDC9_134639 [bioreactor metagenome]|uniref:Uncharacterized protein n=1 Tax=bioreactor metagenome TaxID=1076179 RepID=A0A645DDH6_9ZZZZ